MKAPILLLLAALPLVAADDDSFFLRGATIHPVAAPEIPNGTILVQNGKISGLGAKLTPPKGVRVIDAKGLHVYPGMIDSGTEIGLYEIGSARETVDTTEAGDFNPQLRAAIAINPASEHIAVTRANGITSVVTLPLGGVISGQAALIHLDGWTWEEMLVERTAAMSMQFPIIQGGPRSMEFARGPRTAYPEAKRQQEAKLRDLARFFEESRRYRTAKLAGNAKVDLKYESMIPVLEGKRPMVITAQRERAVREALDFTEKQNVKVILAQVRRVGDLAPKLKQRSIPVVLGKTLALPLEEDDPYDAAFTLPNELFQAGVKIAFGTFSTSFSRNLPYEAAAAVGFGLPYQEAMKAVTLNAAEIWGVADRIGSIQEGRLADLMITDGDPLETRTQVKRLFIAGREVDLENKHQRLYEKYMKRP